MGINPAQVETRGYGSRNYCATTPTAANAVQQDPGMAEIARQQPKSACGHRGAHERRLGPFALLLSLAADFPGSSFFFEFYWLVTAQI